MPLSPISSPFLSPSLGRQELRLETVARLLSEVQDLCLAVRTVEVARPERVRADIVMRFNELRPMIRDVEDQALDLEGELNDEVAAIIVAYRRLERMVDNVLSHLDNALRREDSRELERRGSADDLQDRLERDLPYGRVRRSYDGWRRRP